ncbi:MAG: hypothetical protein QOJ83_2628, partial [Frankiales bacterium]|nr:hypothetical protein [Frankiales bacterium]
MVAYPPDVEAAEDLAYQLAMNSFVTLFWRQSVLAQTCAWLSAHGYQLVDVSCGRGHTADDMFRDIATAFDFPDYF